MTYRIDDEHSDEIADGLQDYDHARSVAQAWATKHGRLAYISGPDIEDSIEIEPERIEVDSPEVERADYELDQDKDDAPRA